MNNDDIDGKEFEDHYQKQAELSVFVSTLLLLAFIILSFLLCKSTFDESNLNELPSAYEMMATVETIERHGEEFSMTVDGVHDGQLEVHTFAIDRDQFMRYKQGQELKIVVKNRRCYIIE